MTKNKKIENKEMTAKYMEDKTENIQNNTQDDRELIREFFEDLISNTNLSSIFSKVKVEVNKKDNSKTIESVNETKTVILNGIIRKDQPWIENTFGVGDMNRLKSLFFHPNFARKEDTSIQINYKDEKDGRSPAEIVFSNKNMRSRATHRFLSREFLGEAKFRGTEWDVEGVLSQSKINEFFSFSQIEGSREENFILFQDGEELFLSFGKEGSSTHSLTMCILSGCKPSSNTRALLWKTSDFLSILRVLKESENEIKLYLSWRGVLLLEKNTKIATYKYILRSTGAT